MNKRHRSEQGKRIKGEFAERKRTERRIQHLTDVLHAIRNVNRLVTKEKDRNRLLKGTCETLIETRGYHYAWVAIFGESGEVVASAEAGFGEDFLPLLEHLRRGELPICGMRALRESEVVVIEDTLFDCIGCPLSERHPGKMPMTVRLEHAGRVYGLLSISLAASLDAHEEEPTLFQEIASDIAFALHSIELEEEHKRMQCETEERQEYLAAVLRHAMDAIITLDTANRIVEWNPGAERLFDYTYDEVRGKDIDDVVARPDVKEQAIFFSKQMISGKEVPPTEVLRYRKDGTPIDLLVTGSPIIIRDKVVGVVAVYTDITERKRAEEELQQAHDTLEIRVQERTAALEKANEALRAEITQRKRMERQIEEQREYLAAVLRHAPDAIVTLDTANRTVEWNPGAERLFGYTRDEVCGKASTDVIARPHMKGQPISFSKQIASGKEIPPTETFRYRKDGTLVNLIVAGSPIIIRGKVVGAVAVYTDITERKRTEKELRAKEMQIIHADRLSSLGEMATGVAHEINQPLAIISMVAEGRLRDIERGRFDVSILPQELKDILKNVRRIDRIITHMRTFARRVGEWESVEPEGVLDNVFVLLGEQFRIHGVSISREIEADLPAIKVDVNQLEQVFVNILTNAWQILDERAEEAGRDGKAFEKRLVCGISRAKEEAGEYVVFEFADNAYGVPDELKMRVFDPFFTTKEAGKGTGLGLSITYSIVTHALGGKIWVEDNEAGGASFKVAVGVGELEASGQSSSDADN